jgi:hypothetical protein
MKRSRKIDAALEAAKDMRLIAQIQAREIQHRLLKMLVNAEMVW